MRIGSPIGNQIGSQNPSISFNERALAAVRTFHEEARQRLFYGFTKSYTSGGEEMIKSIRKIFWCLGGAQEDILQDCPTDHNRQETIGATVLTNSLLASASFGIAAHCVTGDVQSAVVCGIGWGVLIGQLDRMLVITIRKGK